MRSISVRSSQPRRHLTLLTIERVESFKDFEAELNRLEGGVAVPVLDLGLGRLVCGRLIAPGCEPASFTIRSVGHTAHR
jgi:hypothetical protein